MNFGRSSFITSGLNVPNSNGSVSGNPSGTVISTNSNPVANMVGVEGRYFLSDRFAIVVNGGAIYSNTPANLNVPAVLDPNTNAVIIPAYNAVVADNRADISFSVGAQWRFNTKSNRLAPYLGFAIPVNYARRSSYNPTITNGVITDLGTRNVDVNGIGVQAVAGMDYYFLESFYLGLSIKPLSFNYVMSTKTPGPGLPGLNTENYSISSFVQPLISLGFKF